MQLPFFPQKPKVPKPTRVYTKALWSMKIAQV
jgi:hypothetical protein